MKIKIKIEIEIEIEIEINPLICARTSGETFHLLTHLYRILTNLLS